MPDTPQQIAIADYDYPLPEERIAKFPLQQRDSSKLLRYSNGSISEHRFFNLPDLLPDNTLLVFNNTKVIHARLFFRKPTGSVIEVFCLEAIGLPAAAAFAQRSQCTWLCFIGNNKKWKEGSLELPFTIDGKNYTLNATRLEAQGNAWKVRFEWNGGISFAELIEKVGVIPLPPYLNRDAEESDSERYQTVYARHEGSVAAPTAGLHFTDTLLDTLRHRGFGTEQITLHVGAGTFKPVSTKTIGEHEMHIEKVQASRQNLTNIMAHLGKPIIPVGTTTVRTLESTYWFGVKLADNPDLDAMHVDQWNPYSLEEKGITTHDALSNVVAWMDRHGVDHLDGDTKLLIAPGYRYHVVNGIITNFHQPKSTLLLLVSAMIGDDWKRCYSYALSHDFRFLSYGDSCLFLV